ncbi:hypothetical protein ACNPQM_33490 [Streptomyces sp. NPDC056231]|uniref:hypothetical protein n=1 Tax=unclassified Streptomyces TaxID=2593676 RepID=UPI00340F0C04
MPHASFHCFVTVDGPAAFAGAVGVAGVDLDGRAVVSDAEFDEMRWGATMRFSD